MSQDKPNRKTTRLHGYNYSSPGIYFITICTQNRECIFGEIINNTMQLNQYGKIVFASWQHLSTKNNVQLDECVVMPNHIHGIIMICRLHPDKPLVGRLVGMFKTMSTNRINALRDIPRKIWQRNYHEHIVRDKNELQNIRKYIRNNPTKWNDDMFMV